LSGWGGGGPGGYNSSTKVKTTFVIFGKIGTIF
jgi:hypothetical protein